MVGGRGRRAWNSVGQFVCAMRGVSSLRPERKFLDKLELSTNYCVRRPAQRAAESPPSTFFYAGANLPVEEASMSISRSVSIDPGARAASVRPCETVGLTRPNLSVRVIVIGAGRPDRRFVNRVLSFSPIACELARRSRPCGTSSFVARSGTNSAIARCVSPPPTKMPVPRGTSPAAALFTRACARRKAVIERL